MNVPNWLMDVVMLGDVSVNRNVPIPCEQYFARTRMASVILFNAIIIGPMVNPVLKMISAHQTVDVSTISAMGHARAILIAVVCMARFASHKIQVIPTTINVRRKGKLAVLAMITASAQPILAMQAPENALVATTVIAEMANSVTIVNVFKSANMGRPARIIVGV